MARHYFTLLLCVPLAVMCLGRSRAAADGPLLPGMENAASDGRHDVEPAPSPPSRPVPSPALRARPATPETGDPNLAPQRRRGAPDNLPQDGPSSRRVQTNFGQTQPAVPPQRPQTRPVTPQQRPQARQLAPQNQAPRTNPYNVPGRQSGARTQQQMQGRWDQPSGPTAAAQRSQSFAPQPGSPARAPRGVPQFQTYGARRRPPVPPSRSNTPQFRSTAPYYRAAPSQSPTSASPTRRPTARPQFSRQDSAAASRSRAGQPSALRRQQQQSAAARNVPRPPWESNRRRTR
jgi:hypothetical protein